MPKLRRHRKPRKRGPITFVEKGKGCNERNLSKFIPESDSDFAYVAESFFQIPLESNGAAYGLAQHEVDEISAAVKEFRSALAKAMHRSTRGRESVRRKDVARKKAEEVVRRYANKIRGNPDVSDSDKEKLRIKARPKRLRKRECPRRPPSLEFVGSADGVEGFHVLRFYDGDEGKLLLASETYGKRRKARPAGAARLELYFDMIPPGEPIPNRPDERGWPKFLNSYTRNLMEVEFPMPTEPMLFVYWARWVGTNGDRSRWSKPCVARVEGWSPGTAPALPGGQSSQMEQRVETKFVYVTTPIAGELPDGLPQDVLREFSRLLEGGGSLAQLRERLLESD